MKLLLALCLWALVFLLCWPFALLLLISFPFLWLLSIPFRIVGVAVHAVLALLSALLFLPARAAGWRR